jgi:hypothetical protein
MCSTSLKATARLVSLVAGLGLVPALGADLDWEVESPFRFFKPTTSFALHENAYRAVRGDRQGPPPVDILSRLERRLNDPDCRDPSTPNTCYATRRARYEPSRLGWAAQTFTSVCYESHALPRRYPTQCERRYSWGTAREDYILPEAHTVNIRLSAAKFVEVGDGDCTWTWQPRAPGGKAETRKMACKDRLTIPRVPFSLNTAQSGVRVTVRTHNGREFSEPNVVVEDLLVVGFGDSFASGESNPDKPVLFSGAREMVYDPVNTPGVASRSVKRKDPPPAPSPSFSVAAGNEFDPKSLPKRLMEDEVNGRIEWPNSPEFMAAFAKSGAQWISADCHRSQYGYPFRVGLGLALENRHRAISFVSLACSGAEVTEGLFLEMSAREGAQKKVASQFDQMADLICRGGAAGRTQTASYTLPTFSSGSTSISMQTITKRWCAAAQRKRPIDLVLLSIGGNDVGFGALAVYSITDSANDIAPVADLIGRQIRFSPRTSRVYLDLLDERMKAVKDALRDGFGVDPSRVVHTSYEPIQFDENGAVCGANPTLGLDVHPKFRFSRERLQETSDFLGEFLARLECVSNVRKRADCPAGLATGAGTGFHLVTEHQSKFLRRGICARDPSRAAIDGAMMSVPRRSRIADEFRPYSPDTALPYARHWRLFRTPNDAFMAANVHREGISPFDLLQPAYSGLQSGAVHPTAEAHAIVADHVMPYARAILDKRAVVQAAPR